MSTPWGQSAKPRRSGVVHATTVLALVEFVLMVLAMGFIAFLVVSSATGASRDPHGYTMIFGFIAGIILLVPTILLGVAAWQCVRLQSGGFLMLAILNLLGGAFSVWLIVSTIIPMVASWQIPGGDAELPLFALIGPALFQILPLGIAVLTCVLAFKSYNQLNRPAPVVDPNWQTWR